MESSITIIAENGSIKIGGQYMEKIEYCHVKDYVCQNFLLPIPVMIMEFIRGSAANHVM